MKKKLLTILLFVLSSLSFAQTAKIYKGVVVDRNKAPLEVFSVILFNAKDTTKQIYSNTFTNGDFNMEFAPVEGEAYSVYLLSMGYKDAKIPLDNFRDTVTMRSNSMRLDDAVVEGKRDVTSYLGAEGGVVFDVSNTYLSDLGSSTDLLNFIPGVQADRDGNVKVIGVQGAVVVYINNIRVKDVEKLKMYKSQDIKSVEVLRSPGAKYKNAEVVILIKTNKEYEGFSSVVNMEAFMSGNDNYKVVPSVQASYTKGKVTASASYNLSRDVSESESRSSKVVSKELSSDDWRFINAGAGDNDIYKNWYNANIDYNINEKNLLTFQYSGRYDDTFKDNKSTQDVFANSLGNVMGNKYAQKSQNNIFSNSGHLYYKGTYSKNFILEYNADYSNMINDADNHNTWQDIGADALEFSQKTKSKASVFTTELLLTNTMKEKHNLSYGLEYSNLKDDVASNSPDQSATSYTQNSTFVKTILEYKTQIIQPLSLSLGVNYLYNNVRDNNTSGKGKNYNSIIPYIGLRYYNMKKQFGANLGVKYNSYQPDAGMLDDVTINYINPYEISTGNSRLENMKYTSVNLSFNYKKFYVGANYQNMSNLILEHATVEIKDDGTPLLINRPANLANPANLFFAYVGYNNKIKFWTHSASVFGVYTNTKTPNLGGGVDVNQGFMPQLYISNRFDLPKNFFIDFSGYYQMEGYALYIKIGETYNVNLNVEKRLMNNQLNLKLLTSLSNNWENYTLNINGLWSESGTKTSFYKFVGVSASWRFNNHKEVRKAKENVYMKMLE